MEETDSRYVTLWRSVHPFPVAHLLHPAAYTPAMIEVSMTEAQFAEASRRLQQNGIQLTGNSGTLNRQGVTASYEYSDGVLRINIIKKPMLIPESLIESQLKSYIAQNLGNVSA